jgi:transketolase
MRAAFVRSLIDLASADPRVVLLVGDLGYTVVEPFAEAHPTRFFNVGVAEQNMIGVATGLAEGGFIPYAYSIATFAALRPYEFIRNGPVLHRLPVRVVGVGGGFEYGPAGASHHALEDVAVMRAQPGLAVIAPADHQQAATAFRAGWDAAGPAYYRIGKDDRSVVDGLDGRFRTGRAELVRDGMDALFVAMGAVSVEAQAAVDLLAGRGVRCGLAIVASVNPAPVDDLAAELAQRPLAITVEDHFVTGGVGSLVAEVIAERGLGCRLVRCGVRVPADGITGSERYLRGVHGLTRDALAETALRELRA